jgi:hypothetical protein
MMAINWRKSSYSGSGNQSDCVEMADLGPQVGLRDSKNAELGHHELSRELLKSLLGRIKAGELDL